MRNPGPVFTTTATARPREVPALADARPGRRL